MTITGPGRLFTVSYITGILATTNPIDILTLMSTAQSKVRLRALDAWSMSTAPAVETLGIEGFRSTSTAASTAAALTPQPVAAHAAHPASVTAVTANSSVQLSTTGAAQVLAGAITPDGYHYNRETFEAVEIDSRNAMRMHFRVTAPSAGNVMRVAVCATLEEIGDIPGQ